MMKNKTIFPILILAVTTIGFVSLSAMLPQQEETKKKLELGFPENVDKIMENSCYGCHTNGARSEKALNKLNFSNWNESSTGKKIHTLDEISEVIVEGTMPPEKFLERFPDKKLTKEQAEILKIWAKKEGESLMK